jgi:hypothetical protein
MLRPGPLMKCEALAAPQTGDQAECQRLQLLVGELLQKNQELRSEVSRLREEKKLQLPPVRFAVSKTIFDWESLS